MTERGVIDEVLIVIPARDEAERIDACLRSVLDSCRAVASSRPAVVVVVDDGSVDGTGAAARATLASDGVVIETEGSRPSSARAAGVTHGLGLIGDVHRVALISTDADCVVPLDWVARHLDALDGGAAAVAGIVTLADDEDGQRIRASWARDYMAEVDDGMHPHVHAANLSIRLDVYLAAGGFGDVACAEDIDLWTRVRSSGVEPVADSSNVVATSARMRGRATGGFACALRGLYGAEAS